MANTHTFSRTTTTTGAVTPTFKYAPPANYHRALTTLSSHTHASHGISHTFQCSTPKKLTHRPIIHSHLTFPTAANLPHPSPNHHHITPHRLSQSLVFLSHPLNVPERPSTSPYLSFNIQPTHQALLTPLPPQTYLFLTQPTHPHTRPSATAAKSSLLGASHAIYANLPQPLIRFTNAP